MVFYRILQKCNPRLEYEEWNLNSRLYAEAKEGRKEKALYDFVRVIGVGYVKVRALISDPARKNSKEVEFLADSGPGYMVIPNSIANELGLDEFAQKIGLGRIKVTLADKREAEGQLTYAHIKLMDREALPRAIIFDSPMPLLGAFTLQELGLEIDTVNEVVKESRPFSLGIM